MSWNIMCVFGTGSILGITCVFADHRERGDHMYFLEYVCLGLACVFWTVVLGNNVYVEDCGVCGDGMRRHKNNVSWGMTQRSLSRPGPRTPLLHTQHFPFPPALSPTACLLASPGTHKIQTPDPLRKTFPREGG